MFESFFSRLTQIVPKVKAEEDAEEEMIDPQQVLRKTPSPTAQNIQNASEKNPGVPVPVCVESAGDGGDEDDLIDPQQVLRDKCRESHHAKQLAEKFQSCNDRVTSKSQTTETCVEELFDLLHAIDHCVTEKLFQQLK